MPLHVIGQQSFVIGGERRRNGLFKRLTLVRYKSTPSLSARARRSRRAWRSLFKGTCGRGIYDNMKTAVETIFVGSDRRYNRRFLQMCSHYLVDPVACTPASGWEKGQVENQVGLVRERFFTPRLRFKNFDELNVWLTDRCIAYAKAHKHPEFTDKTIWQALSNECPAIVSGTAACLSAIMT